MSINMDVNKVFVIYFKLHRYLQLYWIPVITVFTITHACCVFLIETGFVEVFASTDISVSLKLLYLIWHVVYRRVLSATW